MFTLAQTQILLSQQRDGLCASRVAAFSSNVQCPLELDPFARWSLCCMLNEVWSTSNLGVSGSPYG